MERNSVVIGDKNFAIIIKKGCGTPTVVRSGETKIDIELEHLGVFRLGDTIIIFNFDGLSVHWDTSSKEFSFAFTKLEYLYLRDILEERLK